MFILCSFVSLSLSFRLYISISFFSGVQILHFFLLSHNLDLHMDLDFWGLNSTSFHSHYINLTKVFPCSVQFSRSVMSDSLRPHESQHTRPPCLSPTPRVHTNSYPLSRWCHPVISLEKTLMLGGIEGRRRRGRQRMSQLFAWSGQSIGVSALVSFFPMNTQDWSPLEWTGWISLESKRLSSLLQHHSSKALLLWSSAFFIVQLSHSYMTTGKKHSFN